MESGGPNLFIRVYDGHELLDESPFKRNTEKRITIELQLDYVKADPNERPFTFVKSPILVAEGD